MRLAVLWVLGCAAACGQPLTLDDVLASVARHYPPLLAALQEGALADADLQFAQGRFDVTFRARLDHTALSDYDNRRFDLVIDQPLAWQGASLFGGYRLGDGSFASYDGGLLTREAGEWRGGLRMPLMRDRAIDSRRAELRKAEWGRVLARLSIQQQRLLITQSATRRYWDWVAAGRRRSVSRSLLAMAERRDGYLREQVAAGALPRFEVEDNARILLQRRSQIVEAERGLQQAAIDLSLFYRDPSGHPLLPADEQLPDAFPELRRLDPDRLEDDVARALRQRPEPGRLEAQQAQNEVDAALARNRQLPAVDLLAGYTQDLGLLPSRAVSKVPPQEWKAGLSFELPLQRRQARAQLAATGAKQRQLTERLRFARDQVRAEVQDAYSAVQAAQRRAELLREEVEATRRVEEAERARSELGEGTLFVLNLREQATADAALREVAAVTEYFRARAVYDLATGEGK